MAGGAHGTSEEIGAFFVVQQRVQTAGWIGDNNRDPSWCASQSSLPPTLSFCHLSVCLSSWLKDEPRPQRAVMALSGERPRGAQVGLHIPIKDKVKMRMGQQGLATSLDFRFMYVYFVHPIYIILHTAFFKHDRTITDRDTCLCDIRHCMWCTRKSSGTAGQQWI